MKLQKIDTTVVFDLQRTHMQMNVADHQICLAHILRELTYLTELDTTQTWISQLAELISEAIRKRKTELWENIDRISILDRFRILLKTCTDNLHQKIIAMQNSLIKHNKICI